MQNNWNSDIFEKLRPPPLRFFKFPNWNWEFLSVSPPPFGNFPQIFPFFLVTPPLSTGIGIDNISKNCPLSVWVSGLSHKSVLYRYQYIGVGVTDPCYQGRVPVWWWSVSAECEKLYSYQTQLQLILTLGCFEVRFGFWQ